jgi:diphosphomevalonate decarboxylase
VPDYSAAAVAHPNIAFIKYWGNRDDVLRLPANGSISMNLADLETYTKVTFSPELQADTLLLNGEQTSGAALARVTHFLGLIREITGKPWFASVVSKNNFPVGAGIASSAAAFAALSLAATSAIGLHLGESQLSRLARRGSGSACRSIPDGFTIWQGGDGDLSSFAISIAPPDYWDLVDCISIVKSEHKPVGSTEGHRLAWTSPLQPARVEDAPRRLQVCRQAIEERDFAALAEVVEQDSNIMHSVMMTSRPPLFYWEPASLEIMKQVAAWRAGGLPVCYTLDAGPNVHVITLAGNEDEVVQRLKAVAGVNRVLCSHPGSGARLVKSS